jgi:hypothetical protein
MFTRSINMYVQKQEIYPAKAGRPGRQPVWAGRPGRQPVWAGRPGRQPVCLGLGQAWAQKAKNVHKKWGISLSAFPHFLKSNLWPILNMFSYLLQEICLDCILYGIIFFFFETYVYCKTHIKQNIYVFNVLLQSEEYWSVQMNSFTLFLDGLARLT